MLTIHRTPYNSESINAMALSMKMRAEILTKANEVKDLDGGAMDLDATRDQVVFYEHSIDGLNSSGVTRFEGDRLISLGMVDAENPKREMRYERLENGAVLYAGFTGDSKDSPIHQVTVQTSNGTLFIENASSNELDDVILKLKNESSKGGAGTLSGQQSGNSASTCLTHFDGAQPGIAAAPNSNFEPFLLTEPNNGGVEPAIVTEPEPKPKSVSADLLAELGATYGESILSSLDDPRMGKLQQVFIEGKEIFIDGARHLGEGWRELKPVDQGAWWEKTFQLGDVNNANGQILSFDQRDETITLRTVQNPEIDGRTSRVTETLVMKSDGEVARERLRAL